MRRAATQTIRHRNSVIPALAGAIAALAFVVGGAAFSIARQPVQPETVVLVQAQDELAARSVTVAETEPVVPTRQAKRGETAGEPAVDNSTDAVARIASRNAEAVSPSGPRIALIIDDVGLNLDAARRTIALPVPLTVAILPYAQQSHEISALARTASHDVLLHMPMEPLGLADPGPNALRVGLDAEDLQARVRWGLAQVPGAVGLNNHMGSRFTQNPAALRVAMSPLQGEDLVFVDSITTAGSRAAAVAEGLGLSALERDIFLDHEIDPRAIEARLADAEAVAQRQGYAVVIGHPHDATLSVLEDWVAGAQARGLEFVTVSTLADQLDSAAPALQASAAQ